MQLVSHIREASALRETTLAAPSAWLPALSVARSPPCTPLIISHHLRSPDCA